jgi:hypothetical protein
MPTRSPARGACVPVLLVLLAHALFPALGAAGMAPYGPIQSIVALAAQEPANATVWEVRTRDGSRFMARSVEESGDVLVVTTLAGARLELPRADVVHVRPAAGRVVDGEFWPEDPNRTRLFFAPTGRPLGAGEAYFSSYLIVFPMIGVGITDRLSIAGGTPILPQAMFRFFYVAPKFTAVRQPGVDLALGALGVFNRWDQGNDIIGVVYGVSTFGSSDRAASLGAGWGYHSGDGGLDVSSAPVLMAAAEVRLSPRAKVLTENWIYLSSAESWGLLSLGPRFIGDRLSADLAVLAQVERGTMTCCFPMVNFVYHFGRDRGTAAARAR